VPFLPFPSRRAKLPNHAVPRSKLHQMGNSAHFSSTLSPHPSTVLLLKPKPSPEFIHVHMIDYITRPHMGCPPITKFPSRKITEYATHERCRSTREPHFPRRFSLPNQRDVHPPLQACGVKIRCYTRRHVFCSRGRKRLWLAQSTMAGSRCCPCEAEIGVI
jgi:hypothetical protein